MSPLLYCSMPMNCLETFKSFLFLIPWQWACRSSFYPYFVQDSTELAILHESIHSDNYKKIKNNKTRSKTLKNKVLSEHLSLSVMPWTEAKILKNNETSTERGNEEGSSSFYWKNGIKPTYIIHVLYWLFYLNGWQWQWPGWWTTTRETRKLSHWWCSCQGHKEHQSFGSFQSLQICWIYISSFLEKP